jgi:hypothetical protein
MEADAVKRADSADESRAESQMGARSLLRYSPALIFFIAVIADVGRWADPDLWGHIRFGQLVLTLRHAPVRNSYSYSAPGYAWHDPEWLAEAALAIAYDNFGIIGLKILKLACTALTVTLLAAAAESRASVRVQLVVLVVAGVAMQPVMQFRPQLFTFVLLSALMVLLARDTYGRRDRWLWLVVPLFALWANTHGAVAAGLAALVLYAAVRALEDIVSGRGFHQMLRLGAVTLASAAATLANPYGPSNWIAVGYAIRNPLTREYVSEWQPLFIKIVELWHQSPGTAINFVAVFALPVGLAICFVARPRGGDLALAAISAMMAVGAVLSLRNMPLVVIASVAPLCHHAGLALPVTRSEIDADTNSPRSMLNEALVGAIALVLAFGTGLFSRRLPVQFALPKGAVDFMQGRALTGNVLSDFAWGDYLIWRMAPHSRVFIDGRYDFAYPMPVIVDYFDLYFAHPRAAAVLRSYPHDFVLIDPQAPMRRVVELEKSWTLVYSDPNAVLFARTGTPVSRLDGLPVRGTNQPAFFP